MTRIILAPDSFKGSLSAAEAAQIMAEGLQSRIPDCVIEQIPLADGGEGLLDILQASRSGERIERATLDPLGRPIQRHYLLWAEERCALVELASASGLPLLRPEERNPLHTSTEGTGLLIADALQRGAREILLGIGGSATHDGGTGILRALGVRLLDAQGEVLSGGGEILEQIATIDCSRLIPEARKAHFTLICDVENPLCGERGAAAVYAPQKGATPAMVEQLERGSRHWARLLHATTGTDVSNLPGAGAAGGVAGGLHALLGAELKRGIEVIFQHLAFEERIRGCDWIITGEGRIDQQSLMGKVPGGVLVAANRQGIPVVALGGSVAPSRELAESGFAALKAATPEGMSLAEALRPEVARENLRRAAIEVAEWILLQG